MHVSVCNASARRSRDRLSAAAHRVVKAGREHQARVRREALEGADAVHVALERAVEPPHTAPHQARAVPLDKRVRLTR